MRASFAHGFCFAKRALSTKTPWSKFFALSCASFCCCYCRCQPPTEDGVERLAKVSFHPKKSLKVFESNASSESGDSNNQNPNNLEENAPQKDAFLLMEEAEVSLASETNDVELQRPNAEILKEADPWEGEESDTLKRNPKTRKHSGSPFSTSERIGPKSKERPYRRW